MEGELKSSTRKKTKTLYIRRAPNEEKKTKKQLMVARKPRPGEDISQISEVGTSVGVKGVRRDDSGKPLGRSILGSIEMFQEVEAVETPDEFMIAAASSAASAGPTTVQIQDNIPSSTSSHHSKNNHSNKGGGQHNNNLNHNNNTNPADPSLIFNAYLHRLQASINNSIEKLEQDERSEQEHISTLLPSERFNKLRDGKVMARWEERQKDWELLQNKIAKKMNKDPTKMLMGESNEFRERLEEYQTVLASLPLHERNIGALWEMSLRNGGPRHAPIGNIFSGLFCPLKVEIPLPKIVRKPNLGNLPPLPPTDSELGQSQPIGKEDIINYSIDENATWRKDRALLKRKKTLKKRLSEYRPHEITMNQVNDLVVVGYDLLQWAHDSSKAVYDSKYNGGRNVGSNSSTADPFAQTRAVVDNEIENVQKVLSIDGDDQSINSKEGFLKNTMSPSSQQSNDLFHQSLSEGPRIHIGPSPYVLLEAAVKEPAESALTLHNMGSTTLFFEWSRSEEEVPSLVSISKRCTSDGSLPSDPSALFAISKDAVESRFLCQNASGVLLPGQSKATVFAFESSTPGSFSETWKLKVTPPAEVLGELLPASPTSHNDNNSMMSGASSSASSSNNNNGNNNEGGVNNGVVAVSLLGACLAIDTNEHRRLPVRLGLDKNVTNADMKEFITSVIREVRTPRREETIQSFNKVKFETLNVSSGLNYTPAIYDALSSLWYKVNDLAPPDPTREDDEVLPEWDGDIYSIKAVIDRMYDPDSTTPRPGSPYDPLNPTNSNFNSKSSHNILHMNHGNGGSLDTSDDDGGGDSVDENGGGGVEIGSVIGEEDEDHSFTGDGNSVTESNDEGQSMSLPNNEDEGGDINQEDDEDDDFSVIVSDEAEWSSLKKKRHEVDMEWKLLVARSAARPLPSLGPIIKEKISSQLASLVVDAVEGTRTKLKINKKEKFAPLPSPFKQFYTPIDEPRQNIDQIWSDALVGHGDVLVDKQTPEYYYRSSVHSTLNESLSKLVDSFSELATNIHQDSLIHFQSIQNRQGEGGVNGGEGREGEGGGVCKLNHISSLRLNEDVENKKVLLLLDLDVGHEMIPDAYSGEEFVLPPAPKPIQIVTAVKFIRKVLKHNPTMILITSEITPTPESDKHHSPLLGSMSLKSIEPMLSAMLKLPVSFCNSIQALETLLKESSHSSKKSDKGLHNFELPPSASYAIGGNSSKTKIILLDHIDADTMIPLPEPEPEVICDDEEEVLPWLGDEKQDPSLLPKAPPKPLDLGEALKPHVDVFVYDTISSSCFDESRCLSKLGGRNCLHNEEDDNDESGEIDPLTSSNSFVSSSSSSRHNNKNNTSKDNDKAQQDDSGNVLRVAGPTLHREIMTVQVLESRPKRPVLAIVGGDDLMNEVKHIDRMIDMVDELVIAGQIGLVFLAALGHKTGAMIHDPAYMPMARALLSKAQMMGVPVTLPVDFVMGDIYVDGNSFLGGAGKNGGSFGEYDENDEDDEPPLESNGFDYDGETLECTVSEGLMKRMHALDLGNQSITLFKELLERCNTILWTGLVGVAQCSAFQQGTRELVDAVVSSHEDRGALVVLGGKELNKWSNLFYHSEDFITLGNGNGITHAFKDINVAKRLLSMVPIPSIDIISLRESNEEELMLEEEIKAKKIMEGIIDSDEEDDDEDELESAEEGDY
mmetsp:Transcript_26024/g.33826  ORF Transcript_26024/g.33826 Transcript_26024/m.33826 type:complete len:1676 (+) Transcript_26024:31-5058(+)